MENKTPIAKGIPASAGRASGRVRIIVSPSDCPRMQDGEVLVARETTPEYMPAILKAVAIVTDRGGVLSHPAIVARELRIPGIVGTGDATKKLAEGTEVVVDGTQGAVFVKHR